MYCADAKVSYWSVGAASASTMEYTKTDFGRLISCLGYNCSFTVKNGTVAEITLRLSTVEKKPSADISALDEAMLGGIKLTFSITTKQSKEAGGVTPPGTGITISSTVVQLSLDLGGQIQLSKDSTAGFVQLDGNTLVFDPEAAVGASARIRIKQQEGSRALVMTKKTADTIAILYRE